MKKRACSFYLCVHKLLILLQHAVGLWTGVLYTGCGITGVLASTRWFVRRQIFVFLLTSIVAFVASVVSIAMTSYGVHLREARLQRRLMPTLSNDNFDAGSEAGVGAVTINLFVTTILEFFLSILSIRVAFKGYRQR